MNVDSKHRPHVNRNVPSEFEHDTGQAVDSIYSLDITDMVILYSKSVAYLFFYWKWNLAIYVLWVILSLLSVPVEFIHQKKGNNTIAQLFFISAYPSTYQSLWIAQVILSLVSYVSWTFFYVWIVYQGKSHRWKNPFPFLSQEDPHEAFYGDSPFCVNPLSPGVMTPSPSYSHTLKRVRIGLSIGFFVLALCVYEVVMASIQQWVFRHAHSYLYVLSGSLVHSVFKFIWRKVCYILTRYELHLYWDDFYRSYFLKVYFFDLITFSLVYVTQFFLLHTTESLAVIVSGSCELDWLSEQFLWILLLDFIALGTGELIWAELQKQLGWTICQRFNWDLPDENYRYKFTVVEEYTKLVIRQYYVLAGMVVVPAIPWVVLIFAGGWGYWRSLYKLVRLCTKPRPSQDAFLNILILSTLVNTLLILIGFPGLIWYFVLPKTRLGCT
jgi:hypothetical protein